jgi:hypothetical protein
MTGIQLLTDEKGRQPAAVPIIGNQSRCISPAFHSSRSKKGITARTRRTITTEMDAARKAGTSLAAVALQ